MSNDLVNSNKNPEVNAFNNGNFGNNTTIAIGEEITQNIDNRTTLFQITEAQTNINALKELINRTNELLDHFYCHMSDIQVTHIIMSLGYDRKETEKVIRKNNERNLIKRLC